MPITQTTTKTPACSGAKTAPLTTTNPLTSAKMVGMSKRGLYGRGISGSRKRKTMAPTTVRKKKEYSPRPLNVSRARKFPNRMYSDDRTVERSRALSGASELDASADPAGPATALRRLPPTCPTFANRRGSQFILAAATVIRPATNELPSNEPATTRQTNVAATMPAAGPRSWVIAVCTELWSVPQTPRCSAY